MNTDNCSEFRGRNVVLSKMLTWFPPHDVLLNLRCLSNSHNNELNFSYLFFLYQGLRESSHNSCLPCYNAIHVS